MNWTKHFAGVNAIMMSSNNPGATISISNNTLSPFTLTTGGAISASKVVFQPLQEAEARIESLERYVQTLAEMVEKLVEAV